jgi:hypothetical protein
MATSILVNAARPLVQKGLEHMTRNPIALKPRKLLDKDSKVDWDRTVKGLAGAYALEETERAADLDLPPISPAGVVAEQTANVREAFASKQRPDVESRIGHTIEDGLAKYRVQPKPQVLPEEYRGRYEKALMDLYNK